MDTLVQTLNSAASVSVVKRSDLNAVFVNTFLFSSRMSKCVTNFETK